VEHEQADKQQVQEVMPTLAQIYEEHAKECTRSAAKTDTSAMIRATGGSPLTVPRLGDYSITETVAGHHRRKDLLTRAPA
jgi:hypothetical protein